MVFFFSSILAFLFLRIVKYRSLRHSRHRLVVAVVGAMVVAFVVQGHAVEFNKGISRLTAGRGEAAVQWDAILHVHLLSTANIHTFALLNITEVERVNGTAGVGHNWRLHVADKSPLCGAEEGMSLDIGGTSAGTKSAVLVLDQQLANQRFTKAANVSDKTNYLSRIKTYLEI